MLGKSCAGKDTLLSKIVESPDIDITPVIPYTTRPKREYETDGIHYNFVSESYMHELEREDSIIEKREYLTIDGIWYYFTTRFDVSSDDDFVIISTPQGIKKLADEIGGDNMVMVILNADDKTRLDRAIKRESLEREPNYSEVCRRYLADEEDFKDMEISRDSMRFDIDANHDVGSCLNQFKRILNQVAGA